MRSSLYRYCVCKDSGFLTGSCKGAENQDRGSAGGNNTRDERDATDLKGDNRKGKKRNRAREHPPLGGGANGKAEEEKCTLAAGQPG